MDLYEYQARDLFEAHGVPVLRGITATTGEQARAAAAELGTPVVVVKAQVKTGGRGKAGGVKVARSPEEAQAAAEAILGMDIKGHTVNTVMIAEGADIAEEYYFSLLLDRANRSYLAMCSKEGGMDIETLAVERPDALARIPVDPVAGLDQAKADEIVAAAGFDPADRAEIARVLQVLGTVYTSEDATLVEVNPLVKTGDGSIVALDGKVSLDGNADFRHPEHAALEDTSDADPLENQAQEKGLNYVKLDGSVGIIGNGAGLVMSTLDVVAYAGEEFPGAPKPANFLDIGGGASAEVMANGLEIIISDEQVRSVFVNVFGGITACDEVANGIVQAHELLASRGERVRAAGRAAGRQQRRGGPPDPHRGGAARSGAGGHDGRCGPPGRRAGSALRGNDMAIFLTSDSKVLVQGMTGSEGRKHTPRMLASGTNVVGGVTPGKGGQIVEFGTGHVPVFNSVAEAIEATGADVTVIFVPAKFTKAAVVEAIEAGIGLAVVITEGVPVKDSAEFFTLAQGSSTRLIGPNCPGLISPGQSNAGIIPADITQAGRIGLVSKSGTLTYQMMYELRDIGFSSCVGIGGDPVIGTTHIDALQAFQDDPDTEAIVMIGEIGGDAEERAAEFIKANVTKPVVGYVAGFTAPEGKTMGHAGAIVSGSSGTAAAKKEALEAAGVKRRQDAERDRTADARDHDGLTVRPAPRRCVRRLDAGWSGRAQLTWVARWPIRTLSADHWASVKSVVPFGLAKL